MPIHKFLVRTKNHDPREAGWLADAHALGFQQLKRVECQDLYFIESQLSQEGLQRLALELLTDPVTQFAAWTELPAPPTPPEPDSVILEVSLRPGVCGGLHQRAGAALAPPIRSKTSRARRQSRAHGADQLRFAISGLLPPLQWIRIWII